MLNTFNPCQTLAKPNGLGDICEKLLYDPYGGHVFRLIKNPHISSMQDTPWNSHTKIGSNWSSSIRGEEF